MGEMLFYVMTVCVCVYRVTCRVLSNQRFPLFPWLPPPCSIWTAAQLWYVASDPPGMTPSRHTVKMLLWMADTDSLLTLSGYVKCKQAVRGHQGYTFCFTIIVDIPIENKSQLSILQMHWFSFLPFKLWLLLLKFTLTRPLCSLLATLEHAAFQLTLNEVHVGFGPRVTVLSGEDADRLHTGLWWGAADPLQLNAELISCQRRPIAVVDVQHEELIPRETGSVRVLILVHLPGKIFYYNKYFLSLNTKIIFNFINGLPLGPSSWLAVDAFCYMLPHFIYSALKYHR